MKKRRLSKRGKKLLTNIFVLVSTITVGFVLVNRINPASAYDDNGQQPMSQTDYFISQIGEPARQLAQDNDLYASVMIAQAILESGSGQSGLSDAPNVLHLLFCMRFLPTSSNTTSQMPKPKKNASPISSAK